MSIDLLRLIASSPSPMSFSSHSDIETVQILRKAGFVIASVPLSSECASLTGPENAAKVLAVTQKGHEELVRHSYPNQADPKPAKYRGRALRRFRGLKRLLQADGATREREAPH